EELYDRLVQCANQRALKLQESVQLLQFTRERGDVDRWLAAREAMLASSDIGKNRDEADALLKRHIDFINELAANQSRMQDLEGIAAQRITEGHSEAAQFDEARSALITRWTELVTRAQDRERELNAAQVLHTLMQEFVETGEWIVSKFRLLSVAATDSQ